MSESQIIDCLEVSVVLAKSGDRVEVVVALGRVLTEPRVTWSVLERVKVNNVVGVVSILEVKEETVRLML